jgi:hypothetical protein
MKEAAVALGVATPGGPLPLQRQVEELGEMVRARYKGFDSEDPLDLGEALWLAHWQLKGPGAYRDMWGASEPSAPAPAGAEEAGAPPAAAWAGYVAEAALEGLEALWRGGLFEAPGRYRLAFREFGTTLGLVRARGCVRVHVRGPCVRAWALGGWQASCGDACMARQRKQ